MCVEDLKDPSLFRTDLRLLLAALGARGDREAMKALYEGEDFADISAETAEAIAIMTDNTLIMKKLDEQKEKEENEKEGFNMCKAWDEIQRASLWRRSLKSSAGDFRWMRIPPRRTMTRMPRTCRRSPWDED